jgi:vacuolar-type H+-ATPase subunit B/Vma2
MLSVSDEMLGRAFDGVGKPRDTGPKLFQAKSMI